MESYINEETIVKNEIYDAFKDDIICPKCSKIIIEPQMCNNCQNVYCRKCIEEWSKNNNKCPNRCDNPNYKKSLENAKTLSKLKFKCKKCGTQFLYDEIKKHADECKQDKNIEENIDNNKRRIKKIEKAEIEKVRNNREILRITCKNN
jgi:hypothetical protein